MLDSMNDLTVKTFGIKSTDIAFVKGKENRVAFTRNNAQIVIAKDSGFVFYDTTNLTLECNTKVKTDRVSCRR
jgi:hypothetical protein